MDWSNASNEGADYLTDPVCTMVCWKKRTGWGVMSGKTWEQRLVVLAASKLVYFPVGEMDTTKSRAVLDLVESQAYCTVATPSPDSPSGFELEIKATQPREKTWRFCFTSQEEQMLFLEAVHEVLEKGGCMNERDIHRFEHDLHPGDHIYRWELIVAPPIIYPIQIHGLVLEAGRNAVIVADFGLTGYSKREGASFNHAEDHEAQAAIQSAWKKLRPDGQDQRLCINTLTDPKEMKKWRKATYGMRKKSSHHFNFSSLTKYANMRRPQVRSDASVHAEESFEEDSDHKTLDNDGDSTADDDLVDFNETLKRVSARKENKNLVETGDSDKEVVSSVSNRNLDSPQRQRAFSSDTIKSQRSRINSTDSVSSQVKKSPSSKEEEAQPTSDPTKIVLARCHYLLEVGEKVLPPYHVFFSNSECIAVWCKTGRWSTFQTAVFLSTNSVGAAKSATLATIGIAVTNPLLAPLMAVGGLVWVGAPMVILAKSREKWEENTQKMTDLFWAWAPSDVYVEAIQHWGGLALEE